MVRTDYQYGLNPVVVKALINLHYRYSNETPKMWCSRIRVPFKKLIGYNSKFFSKHEFIHMTERSYNGEFGKRSFHIYCTVCDSLVFIFENSEECANKHLNECIVKSTQRQIAYFRYVLRMRKRVAPNYNEIYDDLSNNRVCSPLRNSYECNNFKTSFVRRIIKSVKIIELAW